MADNNVIMATGRRKTSIAVVKLVKGKGRVFVNGKTLDAYLGNRPAMKIMVFKPLALTENMETFDVRVNANGLYTRIFIAGLLPRYVSKVLPLTKILPLPLTSFTTAIEVFLLPVAIITLLSAII